MATAKDLLIEVPAMLDDALEEIGALLFSLDARNGSYNGAKMASSTPYVRTCGGQAFDNHGLEPLSHHAAAHLDGGAMPNRSDATLPAKPMAFRFGSCSVFRRAGAVRAGRMAIPTSLPRPPSRTPGCIDYLSRMLLGVPQRRIEVEEKDVSLQAALARLRHMHGLASVTAEIMKSADAASSA